MVLKRFTRGAATVWSGVGRRMRGADWYMVAAEIVMIVLGVLIAFQLDRLAEGWGKDRQRALYVERLAEESGENVAELSEIVEMMEEDTAELKQLLRLLTVPGERAKFVPPPGFACGLMRLPAAELETGAMTESSDAGALELVTDPRLRRLIHQAAAADTFAAGQLVYFRAGLQRSSERLEPYIPYLYDPAKDEARCAIPIDRLASSSDARSILASIYINRVNYTTIRAYQRRRHKALHEAARCLAKRDCSNPGQPPGAEPAGNASAPATNESAPAPPGTAAKSGIRGLAAQGGLDIDGRWTGKRDIFEGGLFTFRQAGVWLDVTGPRGETGVGMLDGNYASWSMSGEGTGAFDCGAKVGTGGLVMIGSCIPEDGETIRLLLTRS